MLGVVGGALAFLFFVYRIVSHSTSAKSPEPPRSEDPPRVQFAVSSPEDVLKAQLLKQQDLGDPTLFKEVLLSIPEETIPELELLDDQAWANAAKFVKDTGGALKAFQTVRNYAKVSFIRIASKALIDYERENGHPPKKIEDIADFLPPAVDRAILKRYDLVRTDAGLNRLTIPAAIVVEVMGVSSNYDSVVRFSKADSKLYNFGGAGAEIERGVNRYEVVNGPQTTFSLASIRTYIHSSIPSSAISEHLDRYYSGTKTRPKR